MKRTIHALLVAMALFMAIPATAQIQWGVKVGANLSNTSLKDVKLLEGDSYTGFFVGPTIDVAIPVAGLGVDGSVLYSMKGATLKGVDKKDENLVEESFRQHALEIPINLKYSFGLGKMASVFVAAGPQFGFDLKSDDMSDFVNHLTDDFIDGKKNDSSNELIEEGKGFFKKANFSINVGVGAKLFSHLQIGVNYNIPLGKTAEFEGMHDALETAFSAKVKTWQISLAYLF